MAALEEFRLRIPAYTPETMPLDRLMEYLNQAAILLGEPHDLHLLRIEHSSTAPVIAMPRPNGVQARKRVAEVEAGGGSQRRRNAFTRLQRMVEEDGGEPATLEAPEGAIMLFEPPDSDAKAMCGIRQPTTIQGELIRVGGAQDKAALLIQDEAGETISGCYASRSLAKELASYLFETVRLSGDGIWTREANGAWVLDRMQVQSFAPLTDRPLVDVIRDLQAIPVDWPSDTIERLKELRSDN